MKIICALLLATPFCLHSQTKPEKPSQHSIGIIAGTCINNFTERQPFSVQEYAVSGFYKFNRFAVALSFMTMENTVRGIDQPAYVYGPGLSLSGDILAFRKIRVPLLIYFNYYKRQSSSGDIITTDTWKNKGCKTGIDYAPFKFPLSVYLYGGINISLGSKRVVEAPGNIYSSSGSTPVAVIDFGLKYAFFRKDKHL